MFIKVRLFATLREGRGKELILDFDTPVYVEHIISRLEIKDKDVAILLVNGLNAKRNRLLDENDVVSIFPPVGGG